MTLSLTYCSIIFIQLALSYGFVLPNNPYDTLCLDLELSNSTSREPNASEPQEAHLLRADGEIAPALISTLSACADVADSTTSVRTAALNALLDIIVGLLRQ